MSGENLRRRTFEFACEAVAFCKILSKRGPIILRLSLRLVDSSTSIGANLEEAAAGQSKPDFIARVFVALKESRETRYWLRLIRTSETDLETRIVPLLEESDQIVAILTTILRKARENPSRGNP
jgi:four helix bundle protein